MPIKAIHLRLGLPLTILDSTSAIYVDGRSAIIGSQWYRVPFTGELQRMRMNRKSRTRFRVPTRLEEPARQGVPLTARDVEEALEERISNGFYALGQHLPPVRRIAAEFGTSPSTVSRALQEMMRNGLLEVHERRFVRVCNRLPSNVVHNVDIVRSVRAIAHKWKLRGGSQESLLRMLQETIGDVFKGHARFVFTECTAPDLEFMAAQLTQEFPEIPIKTRLIKDLDRDELASDGAVVLVPYYHYAEVKKLIGDDLPIVPIHFTPSVETRDKLLTIPPGSHVVVFGRNERSVERIALVVREYVNGKVSTVTAAEHDKLAVLLRSADAVVAVAAALELVPELPRIENLIEVRFELETSIRNHRLNDGPRAVSLR